MATIDDLRKHVFDDAFEMMETIGVVGPLVISGDIISPTKRFLRRVLARHVVLVLNRLYDKANAAGRTGVTASIEGLLAAMEKSPQFSEDTIKKLKTKRDELKTDYESKGGTFDELNLFRNTELAHSLHPHKPTSPEIQWSPLEEFAHGTFDLVAAIDGALKAEGLIERGRLFWECRKDCVP